MSEDWKKDRRKYTRIKKRFLVKFQTTVPRTDISKWHIIPALNLCAEGVFFLCDEHLEEGAILDLSVQFPNTEKPIECLARVQRVDSVPDSEHWSIAAMFTAISDYDRALIEKTARKYFREKD